MASKAFIATTATTLLALTSPHASAAIVNGDVLNTDIGRVDTATGGNYNNFSANSVSGEGLVFSAGDSPETLLADLIRSSDGGATGVSFSIQSFTTTGTGVPTLGIGGLNDPAAPVIAGFGNSVTRDTMFRQGDNTGATAVTFRFAGLDDSLQYDLTLVGYVPSTQTRPDSIYTADAKVGSYNPVGGGFTTLSGLSTDGSGNLDVVWTLSFEAGAGGQLNGFSLAAVPEPSSLALLGMGGMLIAQRRRRN